MPRPSGVRTLDHFGVGGAGGGVLSLRIGGGFGVSSAGTVSCAGGAGAEYLDLHKGPPAPGGGGSGGSLIVQVGGAVRQLGTLDVSGGSGSVLRH